MGLKITQWFKNLFKRPSKYVHPPQKTDKQMRKVVLRARVKVTEIEH